MGIAIPIRSFITPMMRTAIRKRRPPIIHPGIPAAAILSHAGFSVVSSLDSLYFLFIFSNWDCADKPANLQGEFFPGGRIRRVRLFLQFQVKVMEKAVEYRR
jgi:hypothetical protein